MAQKRSTNTRSRVVEEAAKQFYLQGFKETTMRSLATAVGIKHPSLFSIFENKSAIASVLLQRYYNGVQKQASELIGTGTSDYPQGELLAFYALNFCLVYEDRRFAEFFSGFYSEDSETVDRITEGLKHLTRETENEDDTFYHLDTKVLGMTAMLLVKELAERALDAKTATQYFVSMIIEKKYGHHDLSRESADAFYTVYWNSIESAARRIDIYRDFFRNEEL